MSQSVDQSTPVAPDKTRGRRKQALTLKQAKLLKALPASASVSEAGQKAGYCDAPTAHRALKSISEKMVEVLERHGLTPDFAAQKCLSLMNAKEKKFFAFMGSVTAEKEVDALDVQLRALELWAKLYGVNKQHDEPTGHQSPGITIRLELSSSDEQAQVAAIITARRGGSGFPSLVAISDKNSG
jgi:hypothetical protein